MIKLLDNHYTCFRDHFAFYLLNPSSEQPDFRDVYRPPASDKFPKLFPNPKHPIDDTQVGRIQVFPKTFSKKKKKNVTLLIETNYCTQLKCLCRKESKSLLN